MIPKRHMAIRCAADNGKLGPVGNAEMDYAEIIGYRAVENALEEGDAAKLAQTCYKYNLIHMNTWQRAPNNYPK